jgi:hypothetical protein
MYKRANIWDEDKLDVRGNYGSSGSKDIGYTHSSDSKQYHKSDLYDTSKKDENKLKDGYRSNEQQEENKDKEKENKEKTIVDNVEQAEKYKKNEEKDDFQPQNFEVDDNDNKNSKKKQHKSIEEAIKDAIKEEKEIMHVD